MAKVASHSVIIKGDRLKMAEEEKVVVQETTSSETDVTNEQVETNEAQSASDSNVETSEEETKVDDNSNDDDDFDVDFDDDDAESETKETLKPISKRERNRQEAKERRERKAKEEMNGYYRGLKEGNNNINPYTNQPLETDADVELYLTMKEMDKQGLDPISTVDFVKFTNEKRKAEDLERENQEKANLAYQKDLQEFKQNYNGVDIEKLIDENEDLANLIIPAISSGKTLTQAYRSYQNLINKAVDEKVETLAEEKAKKAVQINETSVGSLTDGEGIDKPIDINSMSDKEFKAYWNKKYNS